MISNNESLIVPSPLRREGKTVWKVWDLHSPIRDYKKARYEAG